MTSFAASGGRAAGHRPARRSAEGAAGIPRAVLVVLLLASWTGWVTGPAPAAAQPPESQVWTLYETDEFVFVSQVSETEIQRIAQYLSVLQQVLAEATTLIPTTPSRVTFFVFRDEGTQLPYRHNYEGEPALLSGAFYPGRHSDFVTLSARQPEQMLETAAHEYLHALLNSQMPGAPLWLEEGLAELFAGLSLTDADGDCGLRRLCRGAQAQADLGRPVPNHWTILQQLLVPVDDETPAPGLGLSELVNLDLDSPEYHDFSGQQSFYARAWAVVHYLALGSAERRRQAYELVTSSRIGAAPRTFETIFGAGPEVLEAEIASYLGLAERAEGSPIATSRLFDVDGGVPRLSSRRLPHDELVTRLGELLVVEGRTRDALDHFDLARQVNPKNVRAMAGAGFAAEEERDLSRARALYDAALEQAPDDPLLALRYASTLLVFGRATSAPKLAEARHHLTKATTFEPRLASAWALLLDAHEYSGQAGDADTVFVRLRAADPSVAVGLLLYYVRSGRGQSARRLIDRVLATDGEAVREAAELAVERLHWLQNGRRLEQDLIKLRAPLVTVPKSG